MANTTHVVCRGPGRRLRNGSEDGTSVDWSPKHSKHSNRTKRRQKKLQFRSHKATNVTYAGLEDLPYEMFLHILTMMRPSDLFRFSRTNKAIRAFILRHEEYLAYRIIAARYSCLSQSFRFPVLLESLPTETRKHVVTSEEHGEYYQHIAPWEPTLICSCTSCILRWNLLCVVLDFAYWQDDLDNGIPIRTIPSGKNPRWNQALLDGQADIIHKAIANPLWYACVLQTHLTTTIRTIRRHLNNKHDHRRRFHMSKAQEMDQSDTFLSKRGPPCFFFPFRRDDYYMIEAYVPNRFWASKEGQWSYAPADLHDREVEDIEMASIVMVKLETAAGVAPLRFI